MLPVQSLMYYGYPAACRTQYNKEKVYDYPYSNNIQLKFCEVIVLEAICIRTQRLIASADSLF